MEGAAVTDRELLEKAARAAGWKYHPPGGIDTKHPDLDGWIDPSTGEVHWRDLWRPLTDDGDAFRLAVATRLIVTTTGNELVGVYQPIGDWVFANERVVDGDRLAAIRRAIVRAAAAIGESMPAAEPDSPRDLRFVPYAIQPAADPIAPAILKDSP